MSCNQILDERNRDRTECHACRSPEGKVADIDIAIRASGDDPERIEGFAVMRHCLRKRFSAQGEPEDIHQLWQRCKDWIFAEKALSEEELLRLSQSQLLSWLKDEQPNGRTKTNRNLSGKRRGRPAAKMSKLEADVWGKWKSGLYRDYYDVGQAANITANEVALIIDRLEHREYRRRTK